MKTPKGLALTANLNKPTQFQIGDDVFVTIIRKFSGRGRFEYTVVIDAPKELHITHSTDQDGDTNDGQAN